MPTSPYTLADGTPIPGVTTVIGVSLAWNRDALMRWAWRQGKAGLDYEKTRQKAADAGTLAHLMCERFLMEMPFVPPDDVPADVMAKAHNGFQAFLRWHRRTKMKVVACELKLVSPKLRTGGTIDVLLWSEETASLGDFKTSKRVYPDHLIQTATYREIVREVTGIECETVDILALGRETARFKHSCYSAAELLPAFQVFVRLRELYDLRPTVEGLL